MILGWNFALTRLHMDAYLLKIDPMNSKHQELKQQPKQQHKRNIKSHFRTHIRNVPYC